MTNSLDDMFGSLLADCEKQGILKSVPSYRGDGKKEKPRVIFVESVKIFNPKSLVLLSNEVTCDCCGAVDVHSNTYILKESVNAKGDRLLDMHIQPSVINLPRKIEVVKSTTSMCYLCFMNLIFSQKWNLAPSKKKNE